MRGISKSFPGVRALDGVALTLGRGEVLALTGENGAGKSTLIKILGGAQPPDAGEILIDGRPQRFTSVRDAKRAGIALIHQELMLAPNLDVAGNIFLGNEARPLGLLSPLRRGAMRAAAAALLQRVGLQHGPDTPVARLTVGEMQMVEIAKALALRARIIIMDEPTSSLTAGESQKLFQIIRQLQAEGIAVVYISHRMEEVLSLADRVTVLRDGRHVGELARGEATHGKIVALMVGRELSGHYFPPREEAPPPAEPVLEVEDLLVAGAPGPVSFTAARGEIVGFAGLVGSGRTELMQALFGAVPALGGTIRLEGRAFRPRRPKEAIARGVYLAPEDRKRHGLVLPMTIAENVSLPAIAGQGWGWLDRGREQRTAEAEVARFRVKTPSVRRQVVNLSGGNQQKVVLGKWLALAPRVLILDEPTRGIDVGAKAEIYEHMARLAAQGLVILMVSSELEEVLGMSDRVVVMRERRIAGVLPRAELSARAVAALMTGGQEASPAA
jgi:ribose transport system ATP-binding protein